MDPVHQACEQCFDAHQDDCSGFARAVGAALNVQIEGLANDIVDTLKKGTPWTPLANGAAAAAAAQEGKLVIGGLRGDAQSEPCAHGHVVVVVSGPLAHGLYPSAYWGRLGGGGARNQTVNWAWTEQDRDHVTYAWHAV